MSVIVMGMEMPALCQECDLYIDGACYAKGYRDYQSIMDMSKPADCPLIEVPPHGRLIDLDQIIDEYWDGYYMRIGAKDLEAISSKTVIEAEE